MSPRPYSAIPVERLLADFAACTDHTSYWRTFAAVERRLNYFYDNGMFDEHAALQPEFTRINRQVAPMIEAQFKAIRTYSADELIAMQREFDSTCAETNADLSKIAAIHADTKRIGEAA